MHLAQQRAVENKIRCHQLVDHVVLSPIDGLLQEAADDCFVCFSSHASTPNATIYLSTETRAKPAESKSINLRSGGGRSNGCDNRGCRGTRGYPTCAANDVE